MPLDFSKRALTIKRMYLTNNRRTKEKHCTEEELYINYLTNISVCTVLGRSDHCNIH